MSDSVAQRIEGLTPQLEGLEAAAAGLEADASMGVSIRRIARSLETAAHGLGLDEIAAWAMAIQGAADAHLARNLSSFLARVAELRREAPLEEATVLVVEDNRTVAAATRACLESAGHRLVMAQSAAEAESVLEDEHVDVVILDLILPDRDGRDVLVRMRERLSTATIPVIVLSSMPGAVARAECMAVGADEFMEKPADPDELRAAVLRQTRSAKRRRNAVRDEVTRLANRAGIHAEYEHHRRKAAERGTPLSLAVLALDSLAEITMKMGRDDGDRFLLEVCDTVSETMHADDVLGRWETGELVAVLPGRTGEEAERLVERAIRSLDEAEALREIREAGIEVAVTGGVAVVERDQAIHDAISSARRSLYDPRAAAGGVRSDEDPLQLELRRVLVVEDDRVTLTLLNHRLVRDGHEVMSFENGREAHAWAEDNDFDLAVLDVKVPGMDGFELLSRIRAMPRHAGVPILMLTGMGSEGDVIRGLDLGADDYMLKPFSPSELLARARRLLHAQTSGAHRPGAVATRRGGARRDREALPGEART